jgi:hypothetical protein
VVVLVDDGLELVGDKLVGGLLNKQLFFSELTGDVVKVGADIFHGAKT